MIKFLESLNEYIESVVAWGIVKGVKQGRFLKAFGGKKVVRFFWKRQERNEN